MKSESEDKKLILISVNVLHKVDPNVQIDSNNSPSGKLFQLINSVNNGFDSLERTTTHKVLDKFKDVRKQTFWRMIEDDRVRLNKRSQIISDTLSKA